MFKLTIRTPYEDIYVGKAKSLRFADEEGALEILPHHAAFTATLVFSPIVIIEENKEETFLARNGIFLFNNEKNEGTMLVNYCEKKSEISYQTVEEYAKFIEQQLEEGHDLSEFQVLFLRNERVAVEQQMRVMDEKKK